MNEDCPITVCIECGADVAKEPHVAFCSNSHADAKTIAEQAEEWKRKNKEGARHAKP